MRRIETYVGQQVMEWCDSAQAQNTMTAIAKVCAALFGTSGTVNGLACTPTSPATMTVQIGAGEIYQIEPLEATVCGTLPADTTHQILKQGVQLGTFTTGAFATPGTSGQSINYLIEAQYQDSDISLDPTTGNTAIVLQFYNAANPSTPWSGPNNSGSTSNTFRDGVVAYQIKAGVAATTGSQVTPSPDTGWIGLWVVTVPFGASSLTAGNISQYTAAPILPTGMLQSILTSNLTYGVDNGSANTIQATFPIPVTTLTDGMDIWVKIKAANTGATTFTPNPGVISASPVVGAAHAALQGGELVANGRANLIWRQDITSWVLVECTGAAIQVAPATASLHAMQLGQATGRLLRTSVYTKVAGVQNVSVDGGANTTTGATSFFSLAATNKVIVEVLGGGGGGGGSGAQGASTYGLGGGGASGSFARSILTAGFSGGISVTVGSAGAGASAGAGSGTAGGASSFGALISAPGGGAGGSTGSLTSPAATTSNGLPNGSATGGNILNSGGQSSSPGLVIGAAVYAGTGGSSPYGSGASGAGTNSAGGAGTGYGSGGSGACTGPSGGAFAGGSGTSGYIVVWEYA